ncbi:MAG: Co2+/Mg2+ efflux protein ApaG [Flavobacteriales bacterium]|nr:Co2+/Mg2+ efflux protein ApaG [Flavobacteriales bacterium]
MLTEVTSGIRISVEVRYEENLSSALMESFVFSYHITVENQNDFPVKLLRRHWHIFDSIAIKREVEGPGVVGEMPVIMPGDFYRYSSACDLRSMRGTMSGFYTMQQPGHREFIQVKIPMFSLEVPYSKN